MTQSIDLIRELEALADRVYKRYPAINSGGCCVLAAAVAEHLTKLVPTRVAIEMWDRRTQIAIGSVRRYTNNSKDKGQWDRYISFPHVVTQFYYNKQWWTFDAAAGVRRYDKELFRRGYLTTDEAKAFANSTDWNAKFNRKDVPGVRRMVTSFFKSLNHE